MFEDVSLFDANEATMHSATFYWCGGEEFLRFETKECVEIKQLKRERKINFGTRREQHLKIKVIISLKVSFCADIVIRNFVTIKKNIEAKR